MACPERADGIAKSAQWRHTRPLTLLHCDCTNGWIRFPLPLCFMGIIHVALLSTSWAEKRNRRQRGCLRKSTGAYPIQYGRPPHEDSLQKKKPCLLQPFSARLRLRRLSADDRLQNRNLSVNSRKSSVYDVTVLSLLSHRHIRHMGRCLIIAWWG